MGRGRRRLDIVDEAEVAARARVEYSVAVADSSEQSLVGSRIDELAIWASDESSNAAAIYNSGSTHDLSLLSSPPDHWYRMGDGDTFPTLQDSIGSLDLTMTNMTSADIVSDVP